MSKKPPLWKKKARTGPHTMPDGTTLTGEEVIRAWPKDLRGAIDKFELIHEPIEENKENGAEPEIEDGKIKEQKYEDISEKYVVLLDLYKYSDIVFHLEKDQNFGPKATDHVEKQIMDFVRNALKEINIDIDQLLHEQTGDQVTLAFDEAINADNFAKSLQIASDEYNSGRRSELSRRRFRVGIAKDKIIIKREFTSDGELKRYTFKGFACSKAKRLEGKCNTGEILICSDTFSDLPVEIQSNYGPEENIRGKRKESFKARRKKVVESVPIPIKLQRILLIALLAIITIFLFLSIVRDRYFIVYEMFFIKTGKITIESLPSGAEVIIDGEQIGITPYKTSIPVGIHIIKVAINGYKSRETKIEIKNNEEISIPFILHKNNEIEEKDTAYKYLVNCQAGKMDDCYRLGFCYHKGNCGYPIDNFEARKLFEKACNGGVVQSCTAMGFYYEKELGGIEKNIDKTLIIWEDSCKNGDMNACFNLGEHFKDEPIDSDKNNKILYYFDLACKNDFNLACNNLGMCYYRGDCGFEKNYLKAVDLIKKSCDLGGMTACKNMGYFYSEGLIGLEQDGEKSRSYFEKACDGGDMRACNNIGKCFFEGKCGYKKDPQESIRFFELACLGGVMMACENLGQCFEKGECGLSINLKEARKYYRIACDGGDESACERISVRD